MASLVASAPLPAHAITGFGGGGAFGEGSLAGSRPGGRMTSLSRQRSHQENAPAVPPASPVPSLRPAPAGRVANSPFGLRQRHDNSRRRRSPFGGTEGERHAGSASPLPAWAMLRRADFNPPSVFVRRYSFADHWRVATRPTRTTKTCAAVAGGHPIPICRAERSKCGAETAASLSEPAGRVCEAARPVLAEGGEPEGPRQWGAFSCLLLCRVTKK